MRGAIGFDRAYIAPVSAFFVQPDPWNLIAGKVVSEDTMAMQEARQDVATEVGLTPFVGLIEHVQQNARIEKIIAHRSIGAARVVRHRRWPLGLFLEIQYLARTASSDDPKGGRFFDWDWNRRYAHFGATLLMKVRHLPDIYAVDVIRSKYRNQIRPLTLDQVTILVDGVRRTFERPTLNACFREHNIYGGLPSTGSP